ncbi:hypothetical protein DRN86_01950 [Candidatus Geothermarchaeota archaeon]|nr:MAG: hypothetical protein DRN86_01950 [Candidatus Geothermarchaeota archaeon]
MPLIIKCSKCKHLIFYTDSLEGLENLKQIFKSVKRCPSCGKEIKGDISVENIKVSPLVGPDEELSAESVLALNKSL